MLHILFPTNKCQQQTRKSNNVVKGDGNEKNKFLSLNINSNYVEVISISELPNLNFCGFYITNKFKVIYEILIAKKFKCKNQIN